MKLSHCAIVTILSVILSGCSMPEEGGASTSWQVEYEVPLTKITLPIRDAFNKLLQDSTLNIKDPNDDDFSVGDTFQLHYTSNDTNLYNFMLLHQKSLNQNIDVSSLKLKDIPLLDHVLNIPDSISIDDFIDSDQVVEVVDKFISTEFRHILFDSLPDSATVTIDNNTMNSYYSNIMLALESSVGTFFDVRIEKPLRPGGSHIFKVPVKDLLLKDTMDIILNATIDKGSFPDIKELLSVSIDINDLNILDAFIKDDFLDYQFEYSADIPIPTDSFVLNYADLSSFSIPVSIYNPFPLKLDVTTSLPSIIDRTYAKQNQITSLHEIPEQIEEEQLKGNIDVSIAENENQFTIEMENVRVLTKWDKKSESSTMPVTINGRIRSTGKFVSLNRIDDVVVKTENGEVVFSELYGYYNRKTFFEGKETSFKMPFQGTNTVMEKFRDKINLINNKLVIDIDFLMRDHSSISNMNYWCIMQMYCGEEIRTDTLSWSMEDIKDDNMSSYSFDFNDVINSFPDSIKYTIDYEFPQNSKILFSDSLFINNEDSSFISIPVNFNLALATSFAWDISDTIFLELGTTPVPLRFEDSWHQPMRDKSLLLEFDMFNETSLSGSMFGLATSSSKRELLDSMSIEDMRVLFSDRSFEHAVIPLLGDKGISLPGRGNSIINSINISNEHLQEILYSDTLVVKQWMMILPSSDALIDTDFLSLAASLTLSGVQSTDMFNK